MIKVLAPAIAAACLFAMPAAADRVLSGAEAQQTLAGSSASFKCNDGTIGNARYNADGRGTASFRFPNQPQNIPDQTGFGQVRAKGELVCVSWRQLAASGENCFRLIEQAKGRYRGTTLDGQGWCEFSLR
jgi:hypothetical protein